MPFRPPAVVSHLFPLETSIPRSLHEPIPVAADAATLQPPVPRSFLPSFLRSLLRARGPTRLDLGSRLERATPSSLSLFAFWFVHFVCFVGGETGHRVSGDSQIRMSIIGSERPPKERSHSQAIRENRLGALRFFERGERVRERLFPFGNYSPEGESLDRRQFFLNS